MEATGFFFFFPSFALWLVDWREKRRSRFRLTKSGNRNCGSGKECRFQGGVLGVSSWPVPPGPVPAGGGHSYGP